MTDLRRESVLTENGDRMLGRSYIGEDYEPLTFSASNYDSFELFEEVLDVLGVSKLRRMAVALRNRFGQHTTLWGAKVPNLEGSVVEFELYWSIDGDSAVIQYPTEVQRR